MSHPAVDQVLRWFDFAHLRESKLQAVSSEFHRLAHQLVGQYDLQGPEATVGLRKLLEAKDAFVRAAIGGTQ